MSYQPLMFSKYLVFNNHRNPFSQPYVMASPLSLLFPQLTKAGLSCTAVQERPASFTSPSLKSGMTHVSVSCMCMLRTGYFWRTEVLLPQSDCLLFLREARTFIVCVVFIGIPCRLLCTDVQR